MRDENYKAFEKAANKYGNIPMTKQLGEAIMGNNDDVTLFEQVLESITDLTDQMKRHFMKNHSLTDVLYNVYHNSDKIPDNSESPISCKKGCSFCCHINVTMSKPEAELIKDFCEEHNIKIDKAWFKQQRKLTEHDHAMSEFSRCAFLKNNECSIYDARPFNCRNYFAITPAFMCNAIKFPKGTVCNWLNFEKEMLHSAFIYLLKQLGHDWKQDSMARTFLK